MQHLGYSSEFCSRCRDYTGHRLLIFDKVKDGEKQHVTKICCHCYPEHKPAEQPAVAVPR